MVRRPKMTADVYGHADAEGHKKGALRPRPRPWLVLALVLVTIAIIISVTVHASSLVIFKGSRVLYNACKWLV